MAIAERIPGMRPGHTGWNIGISLIYPFIAAIVFLCSPLIVGVAAAVNYHGAADRLSRLPGISAGGSAVSGVAAGVYMFGIVSIVVAASGPPEDSGDPDGANLPATTVEPTTTAPSEPATTTTRDPTSASTTGQATTTRIVTTIRTQTATSTATTATSTTDTTTATTTSTTTTATTTTATATTTATTATTTASTTTATTTTSTTPTTTAATTTTSSTTTAAATTTTSSTTTAAATTTTTSSTENGELTATVIGVVDGDTLDVRYANGSTDTVRLLGVDTPEVHTGVSPSEFEDIPDTEAGREWLSDWGDKASSYSKRIVDGKQVTLVLDEESDRRGYYGRLLAYVRVNSTYQLNYELVDDGYARVYDSTFTQSSRFYNAEADAQANDIGVWGFESTASTTTTSDQPGSGELTVVTIHEDAAGDEYDNLNDEYVTFENTGSETLSLGGWKVSDEANHEYTFPSGFELEPGDQVTLYTGIGSDSSSELYWGMEAPVWNNNGDTVFVRNAGGELIVEKSYS